MSKKLKGYEQSIKLIGQNIDIKEKDGVITIKITGKVGKAFQKALKKAIKAQKDKE